MASPAQTRTFQEVIDDSCNRVAAGFASLGLEPGEVIAFFSPKHLRLAGCVLRSAAGRGHCDDGQPDMFTE